MESIPDWKLPAGTDRGLWDYVQNSELARDYDRSLQGTALLETDLRFCERAFPQPGTLIDLGCGSGRLIEHFAKRRYSVTGVDLSPQMLEVTREKLARQQLAAELIQQNLVELDLPEKQFTYAACLFSTLGMIRGRNHRQQFLDRVEKLLAPDGVFVVHVHNRHFQLWTPGGVRWTISQSIRGLRGEETGDRRMPQRFGGAELTLHHFTRSEITRDLAEVGFQIREIQPVSTHSDQLAYPWFWPNRRAYGYLIASVKASR